MQALHKPDPIRRWLQPALVRFPLPFIVTLVWCVLANLQLAEMLPAQTDVWGAALRIAVAGVSFCIGALLICEANGVGYATRQLIGCTVGILFMLLVWYVEAPDALEAVMTLSPFLLAFSAPYLGARGGEGRFWLFSFRVVSLALVSAVAFVALCGGLSLILLTLNILFDIGGENFDDVYGHIWLTGASLLWPFLMLMGVPRRFDEEPSVQEDGFLFLVDRRINDFVIAPLALVYAAILHIYALVILVSFRVPEGQIGWLTLCYGLLLIGFRLAADILKGRAAPHTEWLLRNWAYLLIVPLVLLFIAIWLRVDAYGVTVSRYYLIMFAIFIAMAVAAFLLLRRGWLIIYLPAAAAVLLFAGTFGPWGAVSLTIKSQSARFVTELERLGLLEEGRLGQAQGAPQPERYQELRSILAALNEAGGLRALEPLFVGAEDNPFARREDERELYQALGERLGLFTPRVAVNAPAEPQEPVSIHANEAYVFPLEDYSQVLSGVRLQQLPNSQNSGEIRMGGRILRLTGSVLSIAGGGAPASLDLGDLRGKMNAAIAAQPGNRGRPDPIIIEGEGMTIAILQAEVRVLDGQDYILSLHADIYLK